MRWAVLLGVKEMCRGEIKALIAQHYKCDKWH